jgi:hypothetical protein
MMVRLVIVVVVAFSRLILGMVLAGATGMVMCRTPPAVRALRRAGARAVDAQEEHAQCREAGEDALGQRNHNRMLRH